MSRNTGITTVVALHDARFRLFPFRSPLLRESLLFSLPGGTEMFQFPPFALHAYGFSMQYPNITRDGFAHSDTPGSMTITVSPRLFAGHRVLHRLLVPRHPPYALRILPPHVLCVCLLYTSPSPRDLSTSRMPSSA
eukprot:TRINITY_DN2261_c0_g1_i7.p2 TRINITY_DN2261_c0_g1~~TRINITY_DN2261_c0_g1_i7.p2  ORF type:complete len:136 (-),score=4.37 TRINITY_DN2261_c0_g1_i7:12-419(-)